MSYLGDNKIWEEEEDLNWDIIEISKVDDKIIRYLLDNLKLDKSELSDNFFISFESLLKIGKKAQNIINSYIKETNEIHNFKIDIFNFMLDFIKSNKIEDLLVPYLYDPDFITRARTIFKIEQVGDKKYLKYILPLLNDPDDSVRWAVLRFLDTFNMVKNPLVCKEIKCFIEKESNYVIKEKAKEVFKKA
ncbi:MAG: HEAT repeat domain-containing protein [Candidatus Hodarchaeota archaeon]